MAWWLELILLLSSATLWYRGLSQRDDVIGLLMKLIGTVCLLVVLIAGRPLLLEAGLLAVALWLPSALRCERQGEGGANG